MDKAILIVKILVLLAVITLCALTGYLLLFEDELIGVIIMWVIGLICTRSQIRVLFSNT